MVDADKVHGAARSIGPIERPTPHPAQSHGAAETSFDAVLRDTLQRQPVRFSAHAEARLQARSISLTPDAEQRLERAVTAAAGKAAQDALILLDGIGLVVNVPNRVVVTALDLHSGNETVVTNIDSAVIAADGRRVSNT